MKYILIIPLAFIVLACQPSSNSNLETLDKKSAREVTLRSIVAGDSVLHITDQKIWANGELLVQRVDTVKTSKEVSGWNAQEKTSLEKTPIYVTVE